MPNFDRTGPPEGTGPMTGRQRGFQGRASAPQPGEGLNAKLAEAAQAMGLHPGFAEQLGAEGLSAINQWTEDVDRGGEIAKLMRMGQKFGTWLEERMARGRPPSRAEIEEVINSLAQEFEVPPALAQQLLGEALAEVQQVTQKLGGGGQQSPQPPAQGGGRSVPPPPPARGGFE